MYYINQNTSFGIAMKCKTLAQFYRTRKPAEGSLWGIRKRAKIEAFEPIDEYIIKGGKLVKTGETHLVFNSDW